ncbi:MAG: hypothetical protein JO187_06350 [Acidobacteria bacterium]|nr:hypothetical protein [Acidobacteriaceae bacterium]MBV9609161.1 hypothetical protein [Acidobacteriota bacterium]
MAPHAVALRITPSVSVECQFWFQDGVWNGTVEAFSITVRGCSFEQAKSEMASALGKHIETMLRGTAATGHAA